MEGDSTITVDVEDWFHILDSPAVPDICQWDALESRVEANLNRLLDLFAEYDQRGTFFWLGWLAERRPDLVRQCHGAGHEVASHGYGHVLAYKVGREEFRRDVRKGKSLLEDIIGCSVDGFRAAGFSTTDDTPWVFDEISAAGHWYDSSVFPTKRGHGGMSSSQLEPHILRTEYGDLVEMPQSVLEFGGRRISVFGGGYLRLAPMWLISQGARHLQGKGRPLLIYIHPREIDPAHPRLPLSGFRKFKCYVNLQTTLPKLTILMQTHKFCTMREIALKVRRA